MSNIYDCENEIREIEAIASRNDGVLPDDEMQALVIAKTKSLAKLISLANYIAWQDSLVAECKSEIARIKALQQSYEKKVDNIKGWVKPYIISQGRPIIAGSHKFSTRKSKGVVLAENFNVKEYMDEVPATFKPNKKRIAEDIKAGIEVKGATLEQRINLSFK